MCLRFHPHFYRVHENHQTEFLNGHPMFEAGPFGASGKCVWYVKLYEQTMGSHTDAVVRVKCPEVVRVLDFGRQEPGGEAASESPSERVYGDIDKRMKGYVERMN